MDDLIQTEIGIEENSMVPEKHKSDKCIFLVAGRMIYRKGHMFLFDALKTIPDNFDYEIRIIGGGPDYERLVKECEANDKLKSHVHFRGKIPYEQMNIEYNQASVFILPSIRETTGSVLLEAMAHGLPVVTIKRFGGPVLFDEDSSWMYDGNTKQEFIENLSKALIDCIKNPEEVSRRGYNAYLKASEYTWAKKGLRYQEIYESLI